MYVSVCMVRQIAIKDALYKQLSMMKGDRSFSYAIESLIQKNVPVHPSAKMNEQASHTQPIKEYAAND